MICPAVGVVLLILRSAAAAEFTYRDRLLSVLVEKVPGILESYNSESGRFGTGVWICQDQHPMYPLAAAYSTKSDANRYYKDPQLLEIIVKAGDPLIASMDNRGQWIFAKKDGSTWGRIAMPWTYSRWIRTFQLVRDDMSPESREAWSQALTIGYTEISRRCLGHVHNIPTHHAMGLYAAGQVLDRPEWCAQAARYMRSVVRGQVEGGYWSEGVGPVVRYNFVYVDALGAYYAMSRDERILPALERAAAFHRRFTYPGGQNVAVIDQRNPYHDTVAPGNVGFTFTPIGRAYLQNQWSRLGMDHLDADLIASLLLYGKEGPVERQNAPDSDPTFLLTEAGTNRAGVFRRGPWFVCLSAYTAPIAKSRWIQDRQNFVGIYHDRVGLILGGGNTKLQPAWSNFTVGDPKWLARRPGEQSPKFLPKGELYHVPQAARLIVDPDLGLDLKYGPETCYVRVRPQNEKMIQYSIEATTDSELPVAAHLTLLPRMNKPMETGAGERAIIDTEPLHLLPEQVGGQVTHAGYRLQLPATASLHWPALPHNPYRKDGRAKPAEGRIEIRVPFDREHKQYQISIEVLK
jgi:hypothetical protein